MKRKEYLIVALTAIIVVALPVAVSLATSNQLKIFSPKAFVSNGSSVPSSEKVSLFFAPEEIFISKGKETEVDLKIDTGKETVRGLKITFIYNSNIITLVDDVEVGTAFPNLEISKENGKITLSGEGNLMAQGTVASFKFKGMGLGKTSIIISGDSTVWGKNEQDSLLYSAADASLTVE